MLSTAIWHRKVGVNKSQKSRIQNSKINLSIDMRFLRGAESSFEFWVEYSNPKKVWDGPASPVQAGSLPHKSNKIAIEKKVIVNPASLLLT
jgi:hypothetical protein